MYVLEIYYWQASSCVASAITTRSLSSVSFSLTHWNVCYMSCIILQDWGYRVKGGIKLWCVRYLGQCLWQFGMWCWVVLWKCTDSSKESCLHNWLSSALVMKTMGSFDMSVHIYQTILCYNAKKSSLQEIKSLSYVRYAKIYLVNNSVKLQQSYKKFSLFTNL